MNDAQQKEQLMRSVVPAELKQLRACLSCSLVKTYHQFQHAGCPNCPFIEDNISDWTTASFDGMIAVLKPTESWVARWQRIRGASGTLFVPGVYAVSCNGKLPPRVIAKMEREGRNYVNRDTSSRT
eukprot:TRINITY_DN4710_c0_g1_i1.p1 TRINITY_DN4710_c0_g1~~TRINITY_DN4710_c0_g1_i1.p1  ORF type:complete len:133 (-),score=11.93 TRINITY_DN4710_c0_g1_i1:55-432(-)